MHGQLFLNGPVYLFLAAVVVVAAGLGVFVIADAFRPRRRPAFSRVPEPAWLYAAVQVAFLAAFAAGQFPAAPDWVRTLSVGLVPVAIAVAVAYLLRVVYPKRTGDSAAPEG